MKKSEFMKKYMRLRPTAKQWREAAEKALRAGCIDLESVPDNFLAVYPLAGADARNIKAMHKWVWRTLDKAARAA